jgi:hypothetical protein
MYLYSLQIKGDPKKITSLYASTNVQIAPESIFLSHDASFDSLCGLVVRVPGYRTEIYCVSCQVRTEFMYVMWMKVDRLCGLVVRVPGYRTEIYFVSCEVRTEYMYVM